MSKSFSMSKRLLAVMAVLCMLLTMIPAMPFVTKAAEESTTGYDKTFALLSTKELYVGGVDVRRNVADTDGDGVKEITGGNITGTVRYYEIDKRPYLELDSATIKANSKTGTTNTKGAGIYTTVEDMVIIVNGACSITESRWGVLAHGSNINANDQERVSVDFQGDSSDDRMFIDATYHGIYAASLGMNGNVTLFAKATGVYNNQTKRTIGYAIHLSGQLFLNSSDAKIAAYGPSSALYSKYNDQNYSLPILADGFEETYDYSANTEFDPANLNATTTLQNASSYATKTFTDDELSSTYRELESSSYKYLYISHTHTPGGWYDSNDGATHYNKCEGGDKSCGSTIEVANHTSDGAYYYVNGDNHDQKCADCSASYSAGEHTQELTSDGVNGHYYICEQDCGYPKTVKSHTLELTLDTENQTWTQTCTDECGYSINGSFAVDPSEVSWTYKGEAQTPTVTIDVADLTEENAASITYYLLTGDEQLPQNAEFKTDIPSITDAGSYILVCRITINGVSDDLTVPVTVEKKAVTISPKDIIKTRGESVTEIVAFEADGFFEGDADIIESVLGELKATPVDGSFDTTSAEQKTIIDITYTHGNVDETKNYSFTYATDCTVNVNYAEISEEDYVVDPSAEEWTNTDLTVKPSGNGVYTSVSLDGNDWFESVALTEGCDGETAISKTVYFKTEEGIIAAKEIVYKLDKTNPTLSISIGSEPIVYDKLKEKEDAFTYTYFGSLEDTIALDAADGQSGRGDIEYYVQTIGEADTSYLDPATIESWNKYEEAIAMPADGQYVIYAKAMDAVGNVTYVSTDVLMWDTQEPVTPTVVLTTGSDSSEWVDYTTGSWTTDAVKVTLSVDNVPASSIAYYEYSTDGGASWNVMESDILLLESEVQADYQFRTVSNSTLTSNASAAYSIWVDEITPMITIERMDTDPYVQSALLSVKVEVGISDIVSMEMQKTRLNDTTGFIETQMFTDFTNDFEHSITENGVYTLRVTNGAGVTVTSDAITIENIDVAKPVVSLSPVAEGWHTEDVMITLENTTQNMGDTTFYYQKGDETSWTPIGNTLAISEDCDTVYRFYAESASGVPSEIVEQTIRLDKTVPEPVNFLVKENTLITFLNTITFDVLFKESQTVTITAEDKTSKVAKYEYYCHNLAEELPEILTEDVWTVGNTFTIDPDNAYVLFARVTDHAGMQTVVRTDEIADAEGEKVRVVVDASTVSVEADTSNELAEWTTKDNVYYVGRFNTDLSGAKAVYYAPGRIELPTADQENKKEAKFIPLDDGYSYTIIFNADGQDDYDGEYTVWYVDYANNISKGTVFTVRIDNGSPKVQSAQVSDTDWVSENVTISGTVSDVIVKEVFSGVETIYVKQGDIEDPSSVTDAEVVASENIVFNEESNTWDFVHTIPAQDYSGKYTVWCKDKAGNISETMTVDVQMDKTSPAVIGVTTNGNVEEDDIDNWSNDDIDVTVTASDNLSNVTEVWYHQVDQEGSVAQKADVVNEGSTYTFTISGQNYQGNFEIWAIDNAGNISARYTLSIRADKDSPVLSTGYSEEKALWINQSYEITGTFEDNLAGLDCVLYTTSDKSEMVVDDSTEGSKATLESENENLSGSFTFKTDEKDFNGYYIIWAKDRAGNISNVLTIQVRMDMTVPKMGETADVSKWTNETVRISGSVSDTGKINARSGVETVYCIQGDYTGENVDLKSLIGEAKSYTLENGKTNYFFDIEPQNYSGVYTLWCVDVAKNYSDPITVAVNMDTQKPESVQVVLGTNPFYEFLEDASFGFFQAPTTLKVYASDTAVEGDSASASGIAKIEYSYDGHVGKQDLTPVNGTDFADFSVDQTAQAYATFDLPDAFNGKVQVWAKDEAGNISEIVAVATYGDVEFSQIVVDGDAPIIDISYEDEKGKNVIYRDTEDNEVDTFAEADTLYSNGGITATVTVKEVNFFADQVMIGVYDAENVLVTDGITISDWTTEGDEHTCIVTIAKDGEYTLNVSYSDYSQNNAVITAEDQGDSVTKDYVSKSIVIDTVAPSVPEANLTFEKPLLVTDPSWTNGKITISGGVQNDFSGVLEVVYKQGENGEETRMTVNGEPYSFPVDAQNYNGEFYIYAVDKAGNCSEATVLTVYMDVTVPEVTDGNATPDTWTNGAVVIEGTVNDPDKTKKGEVIVPSNINRVEYCRADEIIDGKWPEQPATAEYADGQYAFTVGAQDYQGNYVIRVWDNAGNVSEEYDVAVKMDVTEPTMGEDIEADPDVYTNGSVTVRGSITNTRGNLVVGEISPVVRVEYKQGEGADWSNCKETTPWYDEINKVYRYEFTVDEQNYNGGYLIRCYDEAGNVSEPAKTHLHMDTEKPSVDSIQANPPEWTKGDVVISGQVSDVLLSTDIVPSGIDKVFYAQGKKTEQQILELLEKGETTEVDTLTVLSETTEKDDEQGNPIVSILSAEYSFTVNAQDYRGDYTVWTVDVAGNVSDPLIVEVKMDQEIPDVDNIKAESSAWTKQNVVISGTISDLSQVDANDSASGIVGVYYTKGKFDTAPSTGTAVTFVVNEQSATGEVLKASYEFTVSAQNYNGYYTVWCVDDAGNTSAVKTVEVKMDTQKPTSVRIELNEQPIAAWADMLLEKVLFGFYQATTNVTVYAADTLMGETASGIAAIYYEYNGTVSKLDLTDASGGDNRGFNAELNNEVNLIFELPERFYGTLKVWAVDEAGNVSDDVVVSTDGETENEYQQIVVDSIAPQINITYESVDSENAPFHFVDSNMNTVDSFAQAERVYCGDDILVTLTIEEGNFYAEDIQVSVTKNGDAYTAELSAWKQSGITNTASLLLEGEGDYQIAVSYTDRSTNAADITAGDGQTSNSAKKTYTSKLLVIDGTAPVIESVSYDNNKIINTLDGRKYFDNVRTATIVIKDHNFRADEVELLVKAENVIGVDLMPLIEDSEYAQSYYELGKDRAKWTAYENGAFRSKDDRYVLKVAYTADANYTFDMIYTDLAGNVTANYAEEYFTVDKTAPTDLTVTYSANLFETVLNQITFGYYNAKMTVTISAQDDVAGIDHFMYSYIKGQGVSNVNAQLLNEAIASAQITYDGARATASFVIPKMVLDNAMQFNGTVEFTAYDRSENSTKKVDNETIIVDNIRPEIEVSYNEPVQTANTISYYDGDISATIRITEANFYSEDVKVTVTKNGAVYPVNVNWTNDTVDTHTGAFTLTDDGDYTVMVSYTDRSNNAMQEYRSNQLTIDTVIPTITVSNVVNESANADEVYSFTVTADDTNLNASTFSASISAIILNEQGMFEEITVSAGELYTVTNGQTYAYTIDNLEADAIYTMACVVTDYAGHTYSSMLLDDTQEYNEVQFSINRNGSVFTLDDHTLDLVKTYYVRELSKDIVVIETNADPLKEYQVTLNGETLQRGTDYTVKEEGGNGQWMKYTYEISKALFADEGEYQIFVSSKDKVGNDAFSDVKDAAIHFVVDRTAPVVTFTGLEDGGRYQTELQTVTVIPTDDGGALSSLIVQLVDDDGSVLEELMNLSGDELEAALEEGEGKLSFTIREGLYQNVRVICADAADEASGEANVYDYTFTNVSVSSSAFMIFWANKPLRGSIIIGVAAVIGLFIFLLLFKKRKKEDEEQKKVQ